MIYLLKYYYNLPKIKRVTRHQRFVGSNDLSVSAYHEQVNIAMNLLQFCYLQDMKNTIIPCYFL